MANGTSKSPQPAGSAMSLSSPTLSRKEAGLKRRQPMLKATYQRIDKFHAHLKICSQCERHPFDLCPTGAVLLKEAATGPEVGTVLGMCLCGHSAQYHDRDGFCCGDPDKFKAVGPRGQSDCPCREFHRRDLNGRT